MNYLFYFILFFRCLTRQIPLRSLFQGQPGLEGNILYKSFWGVGVLFAGQIGTMSDIDFFPTTPHTLKQKLL